MSKLGTINNIERVLYVRPSDLKKMMFCKRQLFFDHYLQLKIPILRKLKMLIGRLKHFFFRIGKKGYTCEELLQCEVEEIPSLVLVGKPDAYMVKDDVVMLEEYKSYKIRSLDYSLSIITNINKFFTDLFQVAAYAYMLEKIYGKNVFITIRYADHAVSFSFDEKMKQYLLDALTDYKKIIEDKILFDEEVTRKCKRCQYKQLCIEINEKLSYPGERHEQH